MIFDKTFKTITTFKYKLFSVLVGLLALSMPQRLASQNTDFDKKMGAKAAKSAEAEFGIYPDKKMTAYVQSIGKRLVAELAETPFEFQFFIADDFIPNAFALPGGYVYVTRGILALVNTEDELACVMAHEITHVTERHSVNQMRRGIIPAILMLPGEVVSSTANEQIGKLLNAPIAITTAGTSSAHSRKQESEADTKGVALAAKAGYNPSALSDILNRLSNAIEVITDQKEKKGWLDDHPFTPDRITNITDVCKDLKWEKKAGVSESALNSLSGLVCFDSPLKGIFNKSVFVHPELGFTITFPEGWNTQNESNAVVAERKDNKAGIYLGLEDPTKTAAEYAKEFEAAIAKKHGKKPIVSEPRGDSGYLVVLMDHSGKEDVYMHVLWLKIGNNIFKLIGVAPKLYEENLKVSAKSLRTLSPAELSSVEISVMRITKAEEGETLEALGKRTSSTIKVKGLSVINGLDSAAKLKSGQQIKIVKKEIYTK